MKKRLTGFLKVAVSLGIGIGLVAWFILQMSESDRQQALQDIKRANYFWVVLPPVIALISNYFRAQRWRLLLRPLGYNPGFVNTFLSIMIMYFINLFIPRLGEVSRCGILARYEKVPIDKGIGTMVTERFMDVVCLGIVALLLIATQYTQFIDLSHAIAQKTAESSDIISKYRLNPVIKYGIILSVTFLVLIFIAFQVRKYGWENIVASGRERVLGLIKGIISIKDIRNPLPILYHTFMIWLSYFLMAWVSFRMFPETSHLGALAGFMSLFFGGAAYALTPGGLGLAPIFATIVLGLYGITGSVAISFGWVSWSVQTIAVLLTGVVSLILIAIINREPSLENGPELSTSSGNSGDAG